MKTAPSLLSADFSDLKTALALLESSGADYVHMDIMDGHFVPNITFGPDQLADLRKACSIPFDVHLMIEDPDRYIERFAPSAAFITVHQEACRHLHRTLSLIRSFNVKAGVALNPATPVDSIQHVLDVTDLILIMSVNPGFAAQSYIESATEKIAQAKRLVAARDIAIQVDGGINEKTALLAANAGADMLVAGSYVFRDGAESVASRIAFLASL